MPQTVGQYLGASKGPVINQHDVTDDYRARYPKEFEGRNPLSFGRYLEEARPDESYPEWKARIHKEKSR